MTVIIHYIILPTHRAEQDGILSVVIVQEMGRCLVLGTPIPGNHHTHTSGTNTPNSQSKVHVVTHTMHSPSNTTYRRTAITGTSLDVPIS